MVREINRFKGNNKPELQKNLVSYSSRKNIYQKFPKSHPTSCFKLHQRGEIVPIHLCLPPFSLP